MSPAAVVSWGELLWDVFADEERLGGCACNVAYHLAALGESVSLVSRVGKDERGEAALRRLREVGVDTGLVQIDPEQPTGVVRVEFDAAEPRYTIVERVAWDRIALDEGVARALSGARAFVFGTLAQRTPLAHTTVQRALGLLPEACIKVCDLNLRRPFSLGPVIEASARAADVVKLNRDEARLIAELTGRADPTRWLLDVCGVSLVCETLGAEGVRVATKEGDFLSPGFPISGRGDTVGAGDAFCARLVHGLLAREPLAVTAREANRHAARVASLCGATPPLEELRATAFGAGA